MKKKLCWVLFFVVALKPCFSQSIVVNTPDSVFYLNQGSLCSFAWTGTYCGVGVFSTAIHKDTLYILSTNSSLYRVKLGSPATCTLLTTFPINDPWGAGRSTVNSMTTDKDGMIYTADGTSRDIIRYNPYTNVKQFLGQTNVYPGGDMMFYKGKLLLATLGFGIYEVNLNNPPASVQYMPTDGHTFYGLISVPYDCTTNKYYGLEVFADKTKLIELDLENKLVGAFACELPKVIYDAATNVDDGNTIGVTIDSFHVMPACGNNTSANLQIIAHSAADGSLTYVLDGNLTNNTGIFNGIPEGPHFVKVTNAISCFKDSSLSVFHGLSQIAINAVNPVSCDQQNGSISITASSGYLPVTYKIDQGSFQTSPVFNNLSAGIHTIKISDAGGCEKDTTVYLRYQVMPSYFSSMTVQPTICNGNSGSITISIPASTNPADVSASLNNGAIQSSLLFQGLDAGSYTVSVFFQNSCRYDTLITIARLYNERPLIDMDIADQQCMVNNGSVNISINGANNPYLVNFNNAAYTANTIYSNLAGGSYVIRVQDKNTCTFDTAAEVKPYIVSPYLLSKQKIDPTCIKPQEGQIMIKVSGGQSPYNLKLNNRIYPNGSPISNLAHGNYNISILNNDNCEIDTVNITLNMELTQECDFVYIPNAFTPNYDGLNDILMPFLGEGIKDFQFTIYNRWGQLIYFSNKKGTGWDGKLAGVSQPGGVYAWTLSYKTINNPIKKIAKGTLTLIR
jgi:gliding motility-associated-like protein